jgi:molybdate/tungstate transport system substrate-binding protein
MGDRLVSKNRVLMVFMVVILIASLASAFFLTPNQKTVLKVFHAGSLSAIFLEFEDQFEEIHANVDVQRESAGSVDTIRKVTDLNKNADVVASSDYILIQNMMIDNSPKYSDFYIKFARNQLVIAYSDHSLYRNEINVSNWYDIFRRSEVNFGFSNPNSDPCGYRSLMLLQLAEIYYGDNDIFEDLVVGHTSISVEEDGGNFTISAPSSINPDSSIMMRPKEVDLMGLLEFGELDYLIIYRSIAYQHRDSGVDFIELPPDIDLSSEENNSTYGRVTVVQQSDKPERSATVTASPIIYGITIPKNARQFELAVEFLGLVVGEEGRVVLNDLGQPPLIPPKANDVNALPEGLRDLFAK